MFKAHRVTQLMAGLFVAVVLVMPVSGGAAQKIGPKIIPQIETSFGNMTISASLRYVIVGSKVLNLSTGKLLGEFGNDKTWSVAISPDDQYLAMVGKGVLM